jgi:hypothetical protein
MCAACGQKFTSSNLGAAQTPPQPSYDAPASPFAAALAASQAAQSGQRKQV